MCDRRLGVWPVLGLLALLNLALYAPSLDNGFSLDDFNWLERATFRGSTSSFVLTPEPGQILNPIPRALFVALFEVAGLEPLPYRLVVLGLHILATFLLFILVSRLAADRWTGLLAAVLFVLHTAYAEALFWTAAFSHPLTGVLVLGMLLSFLRFLQPGGWRRGAACFTLFLAGCLTKASVFTVLAPATFCLGLPFAGDEARRRGARLLAGMAALLGGVLLLNLAWGTGESYLLERGYYRLGPHMAGNLGLYAAWLVLPFQEIFAYVGAADLYGFLIGALRWVAPLALVALLVAGRAETRVLTVFTFATLLPFLPFVFDPVSRYTYLAAMGFAGVAATLLGRVRWRQAGRPLCAAAAFALVVLTLASAADTRLRDNHYEHRERLMESWVADISRELPEPPPGSTVYILGLPTLAIDPGIHLEAALRLHYGDPALKVTVVETPPHSPPGGALLEYREGHISSRLPDTTG